VFAITHLGAFSSRLAEDLAALRKVILAAPFSSQDAATANFRVSATLTAIDGDGLVSGLSRCEATQTLAGRMSKVLDEGQSAVKAAKTFSISDARTQQAAAANLFGLLPEVLALSNANATIAVDLNLGDQVAAVPKDLNPRPLGSLPPLPTATPVPRATAPPPQPPPPIPNEGYPTVLTSTYYSGYGAQHFTDNVTSVTGSWTQPKGTCDGTKLTAFGPWVGIENVSNLQQIGTAVDCDRGAVAPRYYVWYEMFPKASIGIPMRALPGDKFTATVSRSANRWTLTIKNRTTGQHFSTVQTRATSGDVALWINEAPSTRVSGAGKYVLPLTKVTPVTFTASSATIAGVRRSIGNAGWARYRFDMVTSTGLAKATTSGLFSGGTSFKSTWRHY
jgi:Peptidase A4 family